jgi:penicillin-binding protein 2
MNQEERKTAIRRMRVLVAAACILMLLYGLRLIFLQLVNGDDFKSQATNTTDYKFTVTAARGDIVDSRGERIATSVTGYNVVLNKLLMGDEDLDGMLQKIVELLRANGESWNDTLLISQPDAAGNYTFTAEEGSTRDQKALAAMKDNLGLQQYATANDVMEKLVEDYDLASFPLSWQRTLGGIHYEMQLQAFSNVNNFIMAENVSEATVATIKEHSLSLPGVEIVETSTRSYEQSTVLPHVLGRVGKITAEKWKVTDENGQTTYPLREKGYNMNDIIGISGLESAYEDELRGKDGVETITRNSDGVIVDTALTTVPEPGHTVQLTIDSRFQKAVDKALAENIDMINRVYNTGSMKAAAGAAVVLDVKDGSVLAASNYPSFDQNLYATQYSEYSADESLPLFNRALQGLYTPGSTFKPAVAVAALDSGLINQYSTVFCNGVYTFYKGYSPRCTRHGHSGNIDVVTAIKWSCNIFFYDVGRRTTSDVYDAYAYKMGLGTRTGVEVNEATGRLTTKNDSNYTASLDIQAAIGQGNTVVTPVQLATYAGTLANRGVRYRTHFVKAILDTNTGKVLQETQPEVMDVIEDRGDTFDLVRQGMIGVSETMSGLKNYPVTIACKTGTPQRSETYYVGSTRKHYTNTMMVAYGPAEDAEIALGIVIEYGGGGARAGNLVADIFDAYYAMKDGSLNEDGTIGKQETAADSTSAAQTAPAQTETGTDTAADTATDPAAGTTDAAQETAPAGQDALDN